MELSCSPIYGLSGLAIVCGALVVGMIIGYWTAYERSKPNLED